MDAPLVVLGGQQQQPPNGGHSPDDNEQSAQVLPLESYATSCAAT